MKAHVIIYFDPFTMGYKMQARAIWKDDGYHIAEAKYNKNPSEFKPEDARDLLDKIEYELWKMKVNEDLVLEPQTLGIPNEWIVNL
jgi:hypothetical protein